MINFSGIIIEPEELIYFLKKRIKLKDFCQQIVQQKIISQATANNQIVVTTEEIQAEANRIRREYRLEQASDTYAWLNYQLITPEDWEVGIREQLETAKLKEFLLATKVRDFFNQNQHLFEKALLYQIIVPYQSLAWEIFYQIEEEEMSFYNAAHLYDINYSRRIQCGYVGQVSRAELKPDFSSQIFDCQPNTVMTPLQSEEGYHIFLVEEFIPAELTDELYEKLLDQMFEQWLNAELNHLLFNQSNGDKSTD